MKKDEKRRDVQDNMERRRAKIKKQKRKEGKRERREEERWNGGALK